MTGMRWLIEHREAIELALLMMLGAWVVAVEVRIHNLQVWAWPRLLRRQQGKDLIVGRTKPETIDPDFYHDDGPEQRGRQ